MRQLLALALLAVGCRLELDKAYEAPACVVSTKPVCMDATSYQDLSSITDKILNRNCTGSACHEHDSSNQKARRLIFDDDPTSGFAAANAYRTLVSNPNHDPMDTHVGPTGQVFSDIEVNDNIPLVDPGNPSGSYLYFAMHAIPAQDFQYEVAAKPPMVGFMPSGGTTLCCQKLDAIGRWITAGAPP